MSGLSSVQLSEVREIWESWNGWYWFVTEYHAGTLAFGLVRGWETEWGYFDLDELRSLAKRARVWKVPRKNWAVCPCVVVDDDAASCSRGRNVLGKDLGHWGGAVLVGTTERRWQRQ